MKHLKLIQLVYYYYYFIDRCIGDKNLEYIVHNLPYNVIIRNLDLYGNYISYEGIKNLIEDGKRLSQLKDLNLSSIYIYKVNNIGDDGLKELSKHLKDISELQNLDIRCINY